MKLCAIFICWADWYMLRHAVDNIRPLVDGVIIIGSTHSNYGEHSAIPEEWHNGELHLREPKFHIPLHSETDKRNFGLDIAKRLGYTHFLMADSDEFYKQDEFVKAKERVLRENLSGLVCPVVVYFKSPTLCLGRDVTLVPHIHKLTKTIRHEFNRAYPNAWINGQIRIDPSRSLNINSGVIYTEEIELHHMSWIRKDYNLKIRNSTARMNLQRSTITEDLILAKDGVMCKFYAKQLYTVENRFNIPDYGEILDADLHKHLAPAYKAK